MTLQEENEKLRRLLRGSIGQIDLRIEAYVEDVEAGKRAAAPQPEQSGLVEALTQLLCWAEKQVCTHEETHRAGAIWEICDSCGAKWADDEGGRPAFVWPKAISNARAALYAQEK